jgi:acetyltransferase-like isoleucine patch superfamily enzyme
VTCALPGHLSFQRAPTWVHETPARRAQFRDFKAFLTSGTLVAGRHTYAIPTVYEYQGREGKVRIGSCCSIAPGVTLVTGGTHPAHGVSTYSFRTRWNLGGVFLDGMPTTNGDIVVGCDLWVGTDALILSGVDIGQGAVVTSRSAATRNVPAYSLGSLRRVGEADDGRDAFGCDHRPWCHRIAMTVRRRIEEAPGSSHDERITGGQMSTVQSVGPAHA